MTNILSKASTCADGITRRSTFTPVSRSNQHQTTTRKYYGPPPPTVAANVFADWRARHADNTTDERTNGVVLTLVTEREILLVVKKKIDDTLTLSAVDRIL